VNIGFSKIIQIQREFSMQFSDNDRINNSDRLAHDHNQNPEQKPEIGSMESWSFRLVVQQKKKIN
jgi:hypothetical protein